MAWRGVLDLLAGLVMKLDILSLKSMFVVLGLAIIAVDNLPLRPFRIDQNRHENAMKGDVVRKAINCS